jgi:hypothetical protein
MAYNTMADFICPEIEQLPADGNYLGCLSGHGLGKSSDDVI